MTKKPDPEADPRRPYFRCFPADFLSGCIKLSPDQKAVYYTLCMLLYDAWEPVDDGTVKQRQDLARFCGMSTRQFTRIRDELLAMPKKLSRDSAGRITNPRFERERRGVGTNSSQIDGKKNPTISNLNGQLNEPRSNDLKGLGVSRTRASPESIVQTEQYRAESGDLSVASAQVIESDIAQICRAMGVDLQASVHRHGWAYRWARMRVELNITVADMLASIETYRGQIKFDDVRSLGLFKDRAIEKRVARTLNDRLAGITRAREADLVVDIPAEQWAETLRFFLDLGAWNPTQFGPSPLQPYCIAPPALLERARKLWHAQGDHPVHMHTTNGKEIWKAGSKHSPIAIATPFAAAST